MENAVERDCQLLMRRLVAPLLCWFVFLFSLSALCKSSPQAVTHKLFHSVVQVVNQNDLAKRRQMGSDLLDQHFDFETFAEWTLQDYWKKISPPERLQFLSLFKNRFYENVLRRLSRPTKQNFSLKITSEHKTKEYDELKCRLKHDGWQTNFSLTWVLRDHQWRLADITIAKANLVANYQGQFNKIIRDHGFDELLKRLQSSFIH